MNLGTAFVLAIVACLVGLALYSLLKGKGCCDCSSPSGCSTCANCAACASRAGCAACASCKPPKQEEEHACAVR